MWMTAFWSRAAAVGLPKHYPERESRAFGSPVRFSWPALQPLTEVPTRKGQEQIPDTSPPPSPLPCRLLHRQPLQTCSRISRMLPSSRRITQMRSYKQWSRSVGPPINPYGLDSFYLSVPATSDPWATRPRRALNSIKSSRSLPSSRRTWG